MIKFTELSKIIPIISIQNVLSAHIINILHLNLELTLKILKQHINYQYSLLTCISGIDLYNKSYRFCVSYELLSLKFNSRLRIKTFIDEATPLTSIMSIHPGANWWEREIWDLYGIFFTAHSDMRRLLTDYGFEGHPLRKDFPLSGYIEVIYDEKKKRVVSKVLALPQDFRNFDFQLNWSSNDSTLYSL
jgi:NADH dehydrogenase (ubiquinone) Fe-S protein 3